MRAMNAFGPLLGLAAIMAAVASMYVLLGESPPRDVEFLFSLAEGLFLVYWIVVDARRRHRVPCHDFGFLVGVFFPVSLFWYVLSTRGFRGLLLLGFFLLLLVLPMLCASLVYILRYGRPPF